jgi:RNA 2',3'-cyclic 3'-phosphodiesterase
MDETHDITSPPPPPTQRLFFALWPSDEERRALVGWRDTLPDLRGRLVPDGNLHMTLAFAGNVDIETRDCLEQRAADVRGEPCVVDLDRLGRFSRGLLWIGPRTCPAPLADLAQSLARVLQDCGLRPDPRPFHPHVTLARGTRNPLPEVSPPGGVWRLDAFCLVRSRPAQGYEVLKTYSLCGDGPGSLSEHSDSMK